MLIILINITGMITKLKTLKLYLPHKYNTIMQQETHTDDKTRIVMDWTLQGGWQCIWVHGTTSSKGVAILLNKRTFPQQPKIVQKDPEGRWIWCTDVGGNEYVFALVYTPNKEKENA
eukprot:Phypoly_transcript_14532.p1 GENE.Phypoly_transcript_14532~~Phypoly_transcript_14532.p1  ORF type:complete len:117 (+),score=23.44 Phypoly_transcript_14532:418-768(+)